MLKKIIENTSDIKISILSALLPISLMLLWQINNLGLPTADAGDFLSTAGSISNHFHNGQIIEGIFKLFTEKPWRPVSFHLILFPFMLISKNNILFSAACVHILCLSLITIYAYFIFRIICESKISCSLSAISIGLLSGSFFPGQSFAFAEVAQTPAILASVYHLYASKFMTSKKHSIYALISMFLAITLRPVESILHLFPVLIYYFYKGYKKKIFSKNIILSIFKIIFITILFLSFRGLDFGPDQRIVDLDIHGYASDIYMALFYSILFLTIILFFPNILCKIKNFFSYFKTSKANNNTHAIKIFIIFSILIFLWYIDSWRDLYSWVYRTQFGDIAKATNVNNNFFIIPSSLNAFFINFYSQIQYSGLLPFLIIFSFLPISIINNYFKKIKTNNNIFIYCICAIIFPIIPILFTISNTPRKFAAIFIIIIISGIILILCCRNIKKYFIVAIIFLISAQTISIYNVSLSNDFKYSYIISGALKKPSHDNTERQIIDVIYKNSKNYNFENVDLAFLYHSIDSDIFTTNLINGLITNKTYITNIPLIFDNYSRAWLVERINNVHSIFIINPYGSMKLSNKYAELFKSKFEEEKFEQDKFYNDLMYLYFSGKIFNDFNYQNVECINLNTVSKTYEGCLLINSNHVKSNN